MADAHPQSKDKPKKRKIIGRKKDCDKKKRLCSHVTGNACRCKRYQCFDQVCEDNRMSLIDRFNRYSTKNEQDLFLSSLIQVEKVKQRRCRRPNQNATYHEQSYVYLVPVVKEEKAECTRVCILAFMAFFGIKKSRVEYIRNSLAKTGAAPQDSREQHKNRPHALTEENLETIKNHISSFRGRQSHYSLSDSKRLYLPEELSVTKMHELLCGAHPDACSYETYRKIFNESFNISFGYPRKDTCSTCDELSSKLKHLDAQILMASTADETNSFVKQRQECDITRQLHLRKATTFYDRKAAARKLAQTKPAMTAATFDFQKNLSCPNITTNDVYYRRQLSLYSFNVHVLPTNDVFMFCYDETTARKGSDDICTMLNIFLTEHVGAHVEHVELFCDSCAGQNKNWTVLRYLSYMVHIAKRFRTIKLTFPIRGHSYMECDRDMAPINQKVPAETPYDWGSEFRTSRKTPSPFNVIDMPRERFMAYTAFIKPMYKPQCPVQTRPLREVIFDTKQPFVMKTRDNWNGVFDTAVMAVGRRVRAPWPRRLRG